MAAGFDARTWSVPISSILIVVLVVSGCVDSVRSTIPGVEGVDDEDDQALRIDGVVTDAELRPIARASIIVRPGDLAATTDEAGAFSIGPLDPAEYTVVAEAAGFQAKELKVSLLEGKPGRVWITLDVQLGGVPYHETQIYVTYTFCALPSAPCLPINTVTSQNITPDRPDLKWKIPAPGLANMRYEFTWGAQLTSGDKSFTTRNPEGLFLNCGDTAGQYPTKIYFSKQGPSGSGIWVWPKKMNEGACERFDGSDGKVYYTVNRPRATNATVPLVGLALDQRITNYLTFFFYLDGPPSFTAVPDR